MAQRFDETGSIAAKPTGGSTSALEEYADFLLALIVEQSDMTLDEVVAAMRRRRIKGSRSAVWRFFDRHGISLKKKPAGSGARASRRGTRHRRWMRAQGMFDPVRPVFIDETSTSTTWCGRGAASGAASD